MRNRSSATTRSCNDSAVPDKECHQRRFSSSAGKRPGNRPLRAFLIATLAFVAILCITYIFHSNTPTPVPSIEEGDLAILEEATRRVSSAATVSGMIELSEVTVHIGCLAERMLEQLTDAEEAEEHYVVASMHGGDTAAGNHLEEHLTGVKSKNSGAQLVRVLQRYERELRGKVPALQTAAEALYARLDPMLRGEEDRPLPQAVASLPRNVFSWAAAAAHIYGIVLPEHALHIDDSHMHARSLLRMVNLLSGIAAHPPLMAWSGVPCRKTFLGVSKPWLRFCETSLESVSGTLTRRAAAFEELIALSPQYAPFRLHYAALFTVNGAALASTTSALRLLRAQAEKLSGYDAAEEEFHRPLLLLLMAFAMPLEHVDAALRRSVEESLTRGLNTCDALRYPWGNAHQWAAPFHEERRPPLFDKSQVEVLLAKLRLVVGPQSPALKHPGCS